MSSLGNKIELFSTTHTVDQKVKIIISNIKSLNQQCNLLLAVHHRILLFAVFCTISIHIDFSTLAAIDHCPI